MPIPHSTTELHNENITGYYPDRLYIGNLFLCVIRYPGDKHPTTTGFQRDRTVTTTAQQVDTLIAKHKLAEADKNNPPLPSKRKVKILASFIVNEADLANLPIHEIFQECLPEVLKRNFIDVRIELIL